MGARGPASQPDELRVMKGRKPRGEVIKTTILPIISDEPPQGLIAQGRQREMYDTIVRCYKNTDVLRTTDTHYVVLLAKNLTLLERLHQQLDDLVQIGDEGGKSITPALKEYRAISKDTATLLDRLGMNPSARSRFVKEHTESQRNLSQADRYSFD